MISRQISMINGFKKCVVSRNSPCRWDKGNFIIYRKNIASKMWFYLDERKEKIDNKPEEKHYIERNFVMGKCNNPNCNCENCNCGDNCTCGNECDKGCNCGK